MMNSSKMYRYPRGFGRWSKIVAGGSAQRRLAHWARLLPQIEDHEREFEKLNDEQLRKQSLSLRYEAKSGVPLSKLLPQAYALIRVASMRTVQMRHFDVQIIGGIALFNESIAEMATGEGKTLTATLPLYVYALAGKGSHLATVNDYLAKRDAEWMQPLYAALGMSVGVIQSDMSREDRFRAYSSDITYGTAKEFGFDFLRDQLLLRETQDKQKKFLRKSVTGDISKQPICGEPFFILIDEADSVLIDDARTPLIIGAFDEQRREQLTACYQWAAGSVGVFSEGSEYKYDQDKKSVELTASGRERVRMLPHPEIMNSVGLLELYEFIERAIKVDRDFKLDREYVNRDGEIVIVDESTGRLAEGRKWRSGIHQAVEAKEGVEVGVGTGQAARITVQDLFTRYEHMSGMTGTAITAASEFRKVYKRPVVPIPTNKHPQRKQLADRVHATSDEKWRAIVEEIRELHALGRPVLIGTRSIDKSQQLSQMLAAYSIDHQVLNAHHVEAEAAIVAEAGKPGKITVATNMAGRGTDIKLEDIVTELGGLHVICTELHDSSRIDRQLIGRCARQGDPGTYRQYLSLDDDVLRTAYGKKKAERVANVTNGKDVGGRSYVNLFRRAQKKVEREHLRQRIMLNYHEKQRLKMLSAMGQSPHLDVPE